VDINKIEELFDKVRVAGKIIAEYKQLLEAERSEVSELKKQIAFLQKDNQCLKEENDRLKTLSSTAEKMHKDLENRIISMLDVLPDFDSLKNEVPAPAVENISPTIMEMDFNNCDKEENESSIFDSVAESPVEEQGDNIASEMDSMPIAENPFAMEENEIDFEIENINSTVEDSNLPYFESEEDVDYKNMFAFGNIFESEQNSKPSDRKLGRELPKGVL
jgi:regulator of replication initiation timing